jgi:hypothetical protein
MPIQVTCPGCLTRFNVSEKYAGKEGPCPKCKQKIRVPDASEQIVVHAPESSGPKDAAGRPVLKPLTRVESKVTRTRVAIAVVSVLAMIGAAIGIRIGFPEAPPWWSLFGGALLIGPPVVWAGYAFLRDQELAAYSGRELWLRVIVCSIAFAALWGIYWFAPAYVMELDSVSQVSWGIAGATLIAMLAIGTGISLLALELEPTSAAFHAAMYLAATLGLAFLAGAKLAGQAVAAAT